MKNTGVFGFTDRLDFFKNKCKKRHVVAPQTNGRIFVYFDVHYDKLYYETQYLLRSMHITRNTIEDCAGNGSWKCATESKLPGSKDLESLGEKRRRNKIIINKLRRGGRKNQK